MGACPPSPELAGIGAVISRKDWGLTWNMGLEAGGLVVSDEIRVDIDLELLSPVPEQAAPQVEAPVGAA